MNNSSTLWKNTFTSYWMKYTITPKASQEMERKNNLDMRLSRSEKYKSPNQSISEYDKAVYL